MGEGRCECSDRGLEIGREFLGQGQADGKEERASLAWFAFGPDTPAHQLHEALADGKPKARTSETPRHGSVGLGEGLEEMLLDGGMNADSRVPHGKLQAGFAVLRQGVKTHLNFAALGELYGIAGQI